jgi:hypothetical protein
LRKNKGEEANLCYTGNVLMENRYGLIITPSLTEATDTAERDTVERQVGDLFDWHRITVRGCKAYDTRKLGQSLRTLNAAPYVAQNCKGRKSPTDGRNTRYPGYAISQRLRARMEEIFGWMKTVGNLRDIRPRGTEAPSGWPKYSPCPPLMI